MRRSPFDCNGRFVNLCPATDGTGFSTLWVNVDHMVSVSGVRVRASKWNYVKAAYRLEPWPWGRVSTLIHMVDGSNVYVSDNPVLVMEAINRAIKSEGEPE